MNPIQSTFAGDANGAWSGDAIVAELNASGSALVFSTYLGGTNGDLAYYVAVDSSDNTYVTGWTTSTDFPITPGALQTKLAGSYNMFVAKIAPAPNTSASNVAIQLTSKAAVTFSSVSDPGTTAVTQTSVGPPAPTGFTLGSPATYIELSTTATYSGSITVCFSYAGITFPGGIPQLFHYENGNWVDVTSSVDTVNQVVCGSVTSLSPFALFSAPMTVQGFEPPLAALVPVGQPVPMPGSAFKDGRTLPLKLELFEGKLLLTGNKVSPPSIVALVKNGAALDLNVIDLDSGQANDSGTLFRFSDPDWVYNLSTKNLSAGAYTLSIQTPDGRRWNAGFVLR
jgi:hypothetical protein